MAEQDDTYASLYGNLPKDAPWWARWCVTNWRDGWKWWSSNWSIIFGILSELYAQYPAKFEELIPTHWMPHVAAVAFLAVAALRFVSQPDKTPPPTQTKEKP